MGGSGCVGGGCGCSSAPRAAGLECAVDFSSGVKCNLRSGWDGCSLGVLVDVTDSSGVSCPICT